MSTSASDPTTLLPISPDDDRPFAIACRSAMHAPDLGEAFYGGYQAALHRLFPMLPAESNASLCATESGGGHPKAIRCAIVTTDGRTRLEGQKTFVTGADRADELLVVAREGEREDGTPILRLVRVSARDPGLELIPLPPPPFVPDIHHAVVRLAGVEIEPDDILPGDGYLGYLKPFRTVEDIHVLSSITAHLVARLSTPVAEHERIEKMLASIAALSLLADRDPSAVSTHLALAGVLAQLRETLEALDEGLAALPDPEVASALRRDMALMRVAEAGRRERRARAWREVEGG